jgi:hypothetical protein
MAAARKMSKEVKAPSSPNNFHPQLRKTKMCSFFEVGRCRKGDNCGFAHGQDELGLLPDLTKTSLCLAWKEGTCQNSAATCRFAHGKAHLRNLPKSNESKEKTPLLAKPPGLCPGFNADAETFIPAAELEPMKVQLPPPKKKILKLEPMGLTSPFLGNDVNFSPNPYFAPNTMSTMSCEWDQWDGDTVEGETSSDDGSGSALSPFGSSAWQSPHAQDTLADFFQQAIAADQNPLGSGYMNELAMNELAMNALAMNQLHLSPLFMNALGNDAGRSMTDLAGIAPLMVDLDPQVDNPKSKFSPISIPVSPSGKADSDAPELSSFSPFSGMERLW